MQLCTIGDRHRTIYLDNGAAHQNLILNFAQLINERDQLLPAIYGLGRQFSWKTSAFRAHIGGLLSETLLQKVCLPLVCVAYVFSIFLHFTFGVAIRSTCRFIVVVVVLILKIWEQNNTGQQMTIMSK